MKLQNIRAIAQQRGVTTAKQDKIELIRMIQQTEGNFACFATAYDGVCDQTACLWREDCFEQARKQRPH